MPIDYHDFTNINTTSENRRELHVGDIWINAAECSNCGETIRSRNLHDYVTCKCGNVSVDGGSFYAKRSFSGEFEFKNIVIPFNDVATQE